MKIHTEVKGLDRLLNNLTIYPKSFDIQVELFLNRLGMIGYTEIYRDFATAVYDGESSITVQLPTVNNNTMTIEVSGEKILFIEFGTGIVYPNDHPKAQEFGMIRGEYGQGKGSNRTWAYYGEKGTNGQLLRETEKGDLYLTHGNPANRPVYNGAEEMRKNIIRIAKEVFNL